MVSFILIFLVLFFLSRIQHDISIPRLLFENFSEKASTFNQFSERGFCGSLKASSAKESKRKEKEKKSMKIAKVLTVSGNLKGDEKKVKHISVYEGFSLFYLSMSSGLRAGIINLSWINFRRLFLRRHYEIIPSNIPCYGTEKAG